MSERDEPTGNDYLWDGSGEPDSDVREFERALAPLKHSAPLARIHLRRGLTSAFFGIVAALLVFVALPATQVPSRIAGLFYDDFPGEIGVKGGAMVEYRVLGADDSPDQTARVADALAARGADVVFTKPGLIVVELPGFDEDRARGWSAGMGKRGRLELRVVASGTEYMRRLAAHVDGDERARELGISSFVDMWANDKTGDRHEDHGLEGVDRKSLEEYLAGLEPDLRPEPGREIALEALPPQGAKTRTWRTYYVHSAVELDERDIADAQPFRNPRSGYPEVFVKLTEDGKRKFAELTRGRVGDKIAMLVDGTVHAAPVLQGEISGGAFSISSGHGERSQLEFLTDGLAAALRSGPLPAPTEIASLTMVQPTITGTKLVLARGLFALGLGGVVFLLMFAAERLAPPIDPEVRTVKRRKGRWKTLARAAVTAAGLGAVLFGAVRIGGHVNAALLESAFFDTIGICLMPILGAFVLVELVAALVPRWRPLRTGGSRARLHLVSTLLALPAAALYGWFAAGQVNEAVNLGLLPIGSVSMLSTALMVAAGAFALIAVAELVSRYGLGNGYAIAMLAAIASLTLWMGDHRSALWQSSVGAGELAVFVIAAAACIAATSWALRTRVWAGNGAASIRLPACGVLPVLLPGLLWTALASLGSPLIAEWPNLYTDTTAHLLFHGAVWLALALLISWLASRLMPMANAARLVNGGATSALLRSMRWRAALASAGYILGVGAISLVAMLSGAVLYLDVVALVLATAICMDLVAEWRARWRNQELVAVWPVHGMQSADLAVHSLATNGIDVHTRGLHLRTLLLFLGPFVPVSLMVPRARADEARDILQTVFAAREAA